MRQTTRLAAAVGLLTLLLGLLFAVTLEAQRAASGSATWLPYVGESPILTRVVYDNLVVVAGFVLSPVLAFAVGYRFGRRIDLSAEYRDVLGALLVGSVVGYGLGRSTAVVWLLGPDAVVLVGVVVPALVVVAVRVALVGFAGAALGHLRTTRARTRAGPE